MLVIVLRRSRYPEGSSGAAAMTSIRAAATHFHCRRAWNVRRYRMNVVASVRNPPRENETMMAPTFSAIKPARKPRAAGRRPMRKSATVRGRIRFNTRARLLGFTTSGDW